MLKATRTLAGDVIRIDSATKRLLKSIINIMLHTRTPLIVEYLKADMKREMTINVVLKLKNCTNHLHKELRLKSIFVFMSDSCNAMRDMYRLL